METGGKKNMTLRKEEFIIKYGEDAYKRMVQNETKTSRVWKQKNSAKVANYQREFKIRHPDRAKAHSFQQSRKGGKYYEKSKIYHAIGIPGAKTRIRNNHHYLYAAYKSIIAPDSQIHHEWIPGTADYRGVALVETDQHIHGFVNVIEVLEGEISLLSELEIMGEN
jgi:hypothetical protein